MRNCESLPDPVGHTWTDASPWAKCIRCGMRRYAPPEGALYRLDEVEALIAAARQAQREEDVRLLRQIKMLTLTGLEDEKPVADWLAAQPLDTNPGLA